MDLIKGLENGFFHTWKTGGHSERMKYFKENLKSYVDEGNIVREVTNAPRDARYKIDYYYHESTKEIDTVPFPYLGFFKLPIKILNLDETFNWKKRVKENNEGYSYGDFTIGYAKGKGYFFEYKGEINTLIFRHSPQIVDYSDPFWKEYEGQEQYYTEVGKLLHNLNYFMENKGL